MTDGLIERDLDWHSGIRARQHRGEGLLFFGVVFSEDLKVVFETGHFRRSESLIPVHQLLKRRVGAKLALGFELRQHQQHIRHGGRGKKGCRGLKNPAARESA
jgi:hypothetical protein